MSNTPHHNHDRRHDGDDERLRIENAAAQLRVPVATLRYWRIHRRLWQAEWRRRPGSGEIGS